MFQINDNCGTETQVHSEHSLASSSGFSKATLGDEHLSATPSIPNKRNNKRKTNSTDKADEILGIVGERLRNPEDEFTIIGKNIACKLRRLPRDAKLFAEKLINDVLFQAELGELNRYTKIISENPTIPPQIQPQSSNWCPPTTNNDYQLHYLQTPSPRTASTYYAGYNPSHEVHNDS